VLFINDLPDDLYNRIKMYADDTKILGVINNPGDYQRLQEDIDKCAEWARTWCMGFNIAKCKVMHVGLGSKKSTHDYKMTGSDGQARSLEATTVERDLGVLISDDLKLGAQCSAAAAKANWKLGIYKRTFASRDPLLWQMLWKTHIRPHLEHAGQAWSPYKPKDITALESMQACHWPGQAVVHRPPRGARLDDAAEEKVTRRPPLHLSAHEAATALPQQAHGRTAEDPGRHRGVQKRQPGQERLRRAQDVAVHRPAFVAPIAAR
jgi:hypothetical protein